MRMGEILAELRKDKNLKQKDLAELLNLSIGTISNYETGSHEPDFDTLNILANFFHVSTDYMLGRTNLPYDISRLNEPLIDNITISSLVNTLLNMSPEDLTSAIEYINLLSYRNRMIAEQNNYKENKENKDNR
ncbi:MAG: helix-turn-helix domain-containing protein [Roseburia sp.]|nr:helix-turn-helix domain-containing protein [Roseburia sp.]MCM1277428.1 helix-turn-helix domain-containing protein [Robinsoniella sp.]